MVIFTNSNLIQSMENVIHGQDKEVLSLFWS